MPPKSPLFASTLQASFSPAGTVSSGSLFFHPFPKFIKFLSEILWEELG